MKLEDEIKHEFLNPQQRAFTNVIFTSNWILNKISTVLKPTNLSLQQFNALSILDGQPNQTATVNLIKERLIDRMPNVSRLLNKLLEKGLIVKERNPTDQREVFVKITADGQQLRKKGRTLIDGLVFDLSNEQADLLNDLLERIRS